MSNTRTYLLATYTILLGILAAIGWLFMGHIDDAPGAGMIGLLALLSSLAVAVAIARGKRRQS